MDKQRRKELKDAAKQEKVWLGAYKLINKESGKVFIGTSRNLKNQWDRLSMQLNNKSHPNRELQDAWNESGKESFEFEVLEEQLAEEALDAKGTLASLEIKWAESLNAFGDKGYNKRKSYL
ncbi:MAG: GIY-YIG nuclease family protein [Eubacteriaceae bacterium]|nr:GIY-YIG nuclease family protein [Eubacteriaceae bacterium]